MCVFCRNMVTFQWRFACFHNQYHFFCIIVSHICRRFSFSNFFLFFEKTFSYLIEKWLQTGKCTEFFVWKHQPRLKFEIAHSLFPLRPACFLSRHVLRMCVWSANFIFDRSLNWIIKNANLTHSVRTVCVWVCGLFWSRCLIGSGNEPEALLSLFLFSCKCI